jgi:hypothetical protein
MLKELGIDTGIELGKLQETGRWISSELKRKNLSILEEMKSL